MEFLSLLIINLIRILKFAILARVLLSWIQTGSQSGIARFLQSVTEPVLKPLRSILPRTGMIDLSPLIAFFLLDLIQIYLARYFMGLL